MVDISKRRSARHCRTRWIQSTDRNLRYQQNLTNRQIAIVVLLSTSWPRIQKHLEKIRHEIDTLRPGAYLEIEITG